MYDKLKEDVTIVISVKDTYYTAGPQLDAVLESAPGVPVIYVLSGPINMELKQTILAKGDDHAHVRIIDTGLYFANPYLLRNLAIPYIETKYTMFMFNDVFPHGIDWLARLHAIAEEKPGVDIFQPFIWEDGDAPHAAWNSLLFQKVQDNYYVKHTFDSDIKAVTNPASELEPARQPCFLEDHAFLIRSGYLKEQSILDPGAAYTSEYLDMALSAKYRNSSIWSVPGSQVRYAYDYELGPDDVLMFSYRRSEELCLGSTAYICRKWGVKYWSGRIWKYFIEKQLGGIRWSVEQIPAEPGKQLELLLALFTSIGFNRFSLSYEEGDRIVSTSDLPVPEARKIIEHLTEVDHRGPVSVFARFSQLIPEFEAYSDDHKDRQVRLKSGHLFPVQETARADIDERAYILTYEPFFVIECFDITMQPSEALGLFAGIPSLMLEKKIDTRHSRFRVYLHGRLAGEQKVRLDRFARDLKKYRDKHGGLKIGGHFHADADIRFVDCAEGSIQPVELGCNEQDWKIFYWAWKNYNHDQLVELFHMRNWRSVSGKFLRRVYKYIPVPFSLSARGR